MTDDCSYREGHSGFLSWHEGLTIHPPSQDARLFCVALLPPTQRGAEEGVKGELGSGSKGRLWGGKAVLGSVVGPLAWGSSLSPAVNLLCDQGQAVCLLCLRLPIPQ